MIFSIVTVVEIKKQKHERLFFQAFVFVCFWYQIYCGFSGTVMIDQMYLMLYNFLFTSLPPMAIG
jgi:magnesium-transporting ATPase (P-type)